MNSEETVYSFLNLIQKIYNQGELNPFIELVQSNSRVVLYLAGNPNAHPSEISDALNMSRPNVTANLKNLEQNKLIVRKINPNNRREIYVSLTPTGMAYYQDRITKLIGLFQEWLSLLGPEETEHLLRILEISSDTSNIGQRFKNFTAE